MTNSESARYVQLLEEMNKLQQEQIQLLEKRNKLQEEQIQRSEEMNKLLEERIQLLEEMNKLQEERIQLLQVQGNSSSGWVIIRHNFYTPSGVPEGGSFWDFWRLSPKFSITLLLLPILNLSNYSSLLHIQQEAPLK